MVGAWRSGRFDGADAHPQTTLDLTQEPGGELLMGGVLFFHPFQHFVVDMGQKLEEFGIVHSAPPDDRQLWERPAGAIVDAISQIKKAAAMAAFSLQHPDPLDVCVFDLGNLGRVVVMGAAAPHATGEQVVDDPGDGQHQQQEDQRAADVEAKAKKPKDEQDDDDRPDQTGQSSPPNRRILLANKL
jgi:hypothetical protein